MSKGRWPAYYFAMLVGFCVSNLGNWIYLIALNVFVWRLTESPAAVAGIYVIGPIVKIVCHVFVGSIIDRMNKKKLVIATDIMRAFIVCLMPFANSLLSIYVLIAFTNVASTFFGPSSTYLISTLVKQEHRLRFNSIQATFSSGSFMIGPAIGGALLAIAPIAVAIWINAASFVLCALLLAFIPNCEEKNEASFRQSIQRIIKDDYKLIFAFCRNNIWFSRFLLIYSIALMTAFALDSQEMTFLLSVLHISEGLYGVTVTVAGIGAVIGGLCATALSNRFQVSTYIKVGFTVTLVSYFLFYSAHAYWFAIISFISLGLFMAFSNSGYATYFQEKVEPAIIGRVSSGIQLLQSFLQLTLTLLLGFLCELISLQLVTIVFAGIGLLISILVLFVSNNEFNNRKRINEKT